MEWLWLLSVLFWARLGVLWSRYFDFNVCLLRWTLSQKMIFHCYHLQCRNQCLWEEFHCYRLQCCDRCPWKDSSFQVLGKPVRFIYPIFRAREIIFNAAINACKNGGQQKIFIDTEKISLTPVSIPEIISSKEEDQNVREVTRGT